MLALEAAAWLGLFRPPSDSKAGNIARVRLTRLPTVSPEVEMVRRDSVTGRFEMSWQSELGAIYLLERSFQIDGDWSSVHTGYPFLGFPENRAAGASTSYSETNLNPSAFYRIRRL